MLTSTPMNVPHLQTLLRQCINRQQCLLTPAEVNNLQQIVDELPYYAATQDMVEVQPNRAVWLLTRTLVALAGIAALGGLEPPAKAAVQNDEVEWSRWLREVIAKATGAMAPWIPVSQSLPQLNEYVLVRGDSGYTTTPEFCCLARYDSDFRPRDPWISVTSTCLSDSGFVPTHWRHIGSLMDPLP